jgi:signal transduction histidine kinase
MAPQPGLAGLAGLIDQVHEAGLEVTLRNEIGPLEPGVALMVYRVVQEALTNALKHAGPDAVAEVRLETDGDWLLLEVYDTGRGPVRSLGSGAIGHGLVGMQERVALFGGTLRTGPRPGGGFRVYAKIPLEAR